MDLPVVVGIGINYGQGSAKYPGFTPYLGRTDEDLPIVEEPLPTGLARKRVHPSAMRRMMDLTFDSYSKAPRSWFDRKIASSASIPLPRKSAGGLYQYHLVATNFCPFITFQEWQTNWEPYRADILSRLDARFSHLDDLAILLRNYEPVWVAHTICSEVPSLFRLWQTAQGIEPWLLTCNLNGRNKKHIQDMGNKELPQGPVEQADILDESVDA